MVRGLGPGCARGLVETGCDEFHRNVSILLAEKRPFEDVWREWVKKVSKLPQESLSSQAIEQLTICGLSRHGQLEFENQMKLTDQNVIQSRTQENNSERAAYKMKIQEKVETTWLVDTGADAHVMPQYAWQQLGERTLRTTRVTLRRANECTRRETAC